MLQQVTGVDIAARRSIGSSSIACKANDDDLFL